MENPTGMGGYFGTVGVGIVGQIKSQRGQKLDGNAGVYVGLGDPIRYIGIGTSVSIMGLSNTHGSKRNIGEGNFSVDISRLFFHVLYFKTGVRNLAFWGVAQDALAAQKSYYCSGTILLAYKRKKLGTAFSYVALTAGAGNGVYRKYKDFTVNGSGRLNPFYSLAVPVSRKANAIFEWTGYDLSAGLSSYIRISKKQSFGISTEVTGYTLKSARYIFCLSYSFNLINNYYHDQKN
jgi:hypothetical protein